MGEAMQTNDSNPEHCQRFSGLRVEQWERAANEASALRRAVLMMGFDPDKLIDFIQSEGDAQCKAFLLRHVCLDTEKLRESGAGNLDVWNAFWAGIRD